MALPELRPRSTPEIVDAAFQLARGHFMPLLLLSAVVAIPSLVFGAINSLLLPAMDPNDPFGGGWLMTLPFSFIGMCWTFIGYGAVTIAASEAYLGGTPDPGASLKSALRRARPLIFGNLLGYAVMLFPFVIVGVAGPFVADRIEVEADAAMPWLVAMLVIALIALFGFFWMFVQLAKVTLITPVAVLEDVGPAAAWRRAGGLAHGAKKQILLLVLIAAVVIFSIVFGGFELLKSLVQNETLASALSSLVAVPFWPLVSCLFVVLYYDLRIRKEAFDLELMAEGLGPPDTAEAGGRSAT